MVGKVRGGNSSRLEGFLKALLLEGPEHSIMSGWRHFLIVTPQRQASVMGETHNGPKFAAQMGAEFLRAGTWEENAGTPSTPGKVFPRPRPEILAKLHSENQPVMAI